MMTFAQFQATGRDCDDLATAIGNDFGNGPTPKGRLYLDGLYIDDTSNWLHDESKPWPRWHLLLERSEWFSNNLAELESRLYRWALSDDHIPGIDEIIEGALNAACKSVQDAVGQTDGGLAGVFFSGPHEIRDILRGYVFAELTQG